MRIARFSVEGPDGPQVAFGVVDGDVEAGDAGVTVIKGHPFGPFELSTARFALSDVRLVAPVLPSKVIGIGRNYADHVREMGHELPPEPALFLKPSTAITGQGDPIPYPAMATELEHEAELAIVVGRLCRDLPVERSLEAVLGYTCANDVTDRWFQRNDQQWTRAKGFDGFCPLGPWITTDLDPSDLAVRCVVNGDVQQDFRTSDMIRGVAELMSYVSSVMTLLPGDVILTGTGAGVGPLQRGDVVDVEIDGIGRLSNPVVARG